MVGRNGNLTLRDQDEAASPENAPIRTHFVPYTRPSPAVNQAPMSAFASGTSTAFPSALQSGFPSSGLGTSATTPMTPQFGQAMFDALVNRITQLETQVAASAKHIEQLENKDVSNAERIEQLENRVMSLAVAQNTGVTFTRDLSREVDLSRQRVKEQSEAIDSLNTELKQLREKQGRKLQPRGVAGRVDNRNIFVDRPVAPGRDSNPFVEERVAAIASVAPQDPTYTPTHRPRRHVRAGTPTQGLNGSRPTPGMAPQGYRTLLSDFFNDVYKWAQHYTLSTEVLHLELANGLCELDCVKEFVGLSDDVWPLVQKVEFRTTLVAAIVSHDMTCRAICDDLMYNSNHPKARVAEDILQEYAEIEEGRDQELEKKQAVLMKQKQFYTKVKDHSKFSSWRTRASAEYSSAIISKLGPLLGAAPVAVAGTPANATSSEVRDNDLLNLYVRAYRIGFRMHMDAAHWTLSWPPVGCDFVPSGMVNMTRRLFGDATTTHERTQGSPDSFVVLVGMTPAIVKCSVEREANGSLRAAEETVHHAMVQLAEKSTIVGA